MSDRRREALEAIIKEINPKAYEVFFIEIGVELADIYHATFDVVLEDLRQRKPKKGETARLNGLGLKSVEHSRRVAEIILSKEEKYDYA